VVDFADHVVVRHPHVVEEHVVRALVAHGPDAVDRDARMVERDEEQRDAMVLWRVRIRARADPVPLGEVRRGGPRLLAVEAPAVAVARGLELHAGSVGTGVGLAVADGELHFVAQDLGEELTLHALAAVGEDRLADDADALADLRTAAAGERLVEEVLVDAVAGLASPFLGPRDAEPLPFRDLGHERAALRRVDDLGHVLPRQIEDVGVVVVVEERVDVGAERALLGREVEIHGVEFVSPARSRRPTQTRPSRPDSRRGCV
jgi:hypothetical protein